MVRAPICGVLASVAMGCAMAQEPQAAKPAPEQPGEMDFKSALDSLLAGVKPPPGVTTMDAGDRRRKATAVLEFFRAQLINKACWEDHSDMADARRLTATFRVRFGKDGRFLQPPQLIAPSREPSGDAPLLTFIAYARTALEKCNALGWQIPPEYFELEPAPYYVDFVFVPKVGGR